MAESTDIHDATGRTGRLVAWLARPQPWLGAVAVFLAGFAYRDLLGLGTRYGFARGVEYWLFQPTDSAPLVVLVIAAWLLYRRSNRFQTLSTSASSRTLALPYLIACFVFYGWSVYTGSLDMRVLSFVGFLLGSVALLFGRPGLHALWLPAVFPLFAVQMPAPLLLELIYHLQMWTAEYAGWLLYSIGEIAFVSGDQIIRASQRFQVVEGCSGMRSLETLTMLTVLMVDLFGRRGWHAALLLVSAPVVAFGLNGVRVLTIVLNPHSDIAVIHNAQGIAVLIAGLLIIYGFDEALERILPARANPRWSAMKNVAAPTLRASVRVLVACSTVSLALLLIGWIVPVWEAPNRSTPSLFTAVGDALAEWPGEKRSRDFNLEGSARFDEVFHFDYTLPDGHVDVFVASSDRGQLGASLLSPMTAYPASGFAEIERLDDVLLDGRPAISARVLRRDKQEVLVWHWYLGRSSLAMESLRSFFALGRSPLRSDSRPLVVRLTADITGHGELGRAAAVKNLQRVRDRLEPALQIASRSAEG